MSFLVKICGLVRPADAELVCRAGADAIGLNFWRGSKRFVDDRQARDILAAVAPGVLKVGVFVNASPSEVSARMARLGLDLAQLHGDETPADWAKFDGRRLVRALRVADESSLAQAAGWTPRFFLYDAFSEGYGGSGKAAPWPIVARAGRRPFLLAGGLDADNVAAAIAAVCPDGVDVASGVEERPGVKDAAKVAAFIANARKGAAIRVPGE